MNSLNTLGTIFLVCGLVVAPRPAQVAARSSPDTSTAGRHAATAARDGQHDFDFLPGGWKGNVSRLLHPLTGSSEWVDYDATSVVKKVWDGRVNLDEFEADGPAGHIKGLTLRIYNPESHQWSLYWATGKAGTLSPEVGEFTNGRGEFYAQDEFNGRAILVRYVWSDITPDSYHFEQSFSDDGGKSWGANWKSTMTRVESQSGGSH